MNLTLMFMGTDDAAEAPPQSQPNIHLWDASHAHYWETGNYHDASHESHAVYRTWSDFAAEYAHADPHNNLLVRWDWSAPENGVIGELLVFWVSQRSALIWSSSVPVHPDEEPLVRAFLQPRLDYLMGLWAPLAPSSTGLPK